MLQNTWSLLIIVLTLSAGATFLAWNGDIGGSEAIAVYGVVLGYVFGVATPPATFKGNGNGGGG